MAPPAASAHRAGAGAPAPLACARLQASIPVVLPFHSWSERQAHGTRFGLLLGWFLLILSLVLPQGPLPLLGLRVFWQVVVPASLLVLVLLSHEAWRRLCPLAFISQLPRALGRQRMQRSPAGRPVVARVAADGWLARQHLRLQWALFLTGLSLRLLLLNRQPLALALFLVVTLAAAVLVGWGWSGKAWCQYVCPMAPVQAIVVGPRSLFGSAAHLQAAGAITQSTCRTHGSQGQLQRACVGCQVGCIDIDAEQTFWQSFPGKPGQEWAWYSYPGLVLAFMLLSQPARAGWLAALPARPWVDPLLLLATGWLSVQLGRAFRRWQQQRLSRQLGAAALQRADQLTRLLASFLAVNLFFQFSDPTLGLAGGLAVRLLRLLVLTVSAMWLYRALRRGQPHYSRERTSASLRLQLARLVPDLDRYLEGRHLQDLGADEVFTLAKVLPAQLAETRLEVYRGVLFDLLRAGRLEQAAAQVQLQELRQSLQLSDDDHHQLLRQLALTDPQLLEPGDRSRESQALRRDAAAEAVQDLLDLHPGEAPSTVLAQAALQPRLERIRREQGLEDAVWAELLEGFAAGSRLSRQWLEQAATTLRDRLAGLESLRQEARRQPLLAPLLPVQERALLSLIATLLPPLQAFPGDDPLPRRVQGLLATAPSRLRAQLRRAGVASAADATESLGPLPSPGEVVDGLWWDPDPDTALWVLWVQDQCAPERGQRLRRQARLGLPSHGDLEAYGAGEPLPLARRLRQLLQVPLVAGLPPAALLTLARTGTERMLAPGQSLFEIGDPADLVAILLSGSCEVRRPDDDAVLMTVATLAPGDVIGELAFFSAEPRRSQVQAAGAEGARLLCFEAQPFEALLLQAPEFSQALLRQLAQRLEGLYSRLGPADHRATPG